MEYVRYDVFVVRIGPRDNEGEKTLRTDCVHKFKSTDPGKKRRADGTAST